MPSQTEIQHAKKQLNNVEQKAGMGLKPSGRPQEIAAALEVLCEPGAWHELRTLNGNGRVTASGYFNDREEMAKAALRLNQLGNHVYFTLNPVLPELSARSVNHVVEWPKHAAKDDQIVSRQWFLVDVDPRRPSGISATDEEHNAALARAEQIRQWLMQERNWPTPVVIDTGNGAYDLWRVALPNDDAAMQLVTAVLQALAQRFNDDRVTVDVSTHNSSRIARMPGTLNRKGDNTAERPHRKAQLLDIPSELIPVSREQLEQVASGFTASADLQMPASASPELQTVLASLGQHGITVKEPTRYQDGLKYILSACLFNPDHDGTSAAIIEYGSGAKQYSCLHTECNGKKWGDVLRELHLTKPKEQAKPAGQPSRVVISQLPDVREIAAQKIEYHVSGVVVKDAITLFTGQPGSGKTTLALWMANAIARGSEILGAVCEKHPVLYMTRELPVALAADLARRFRIDNGPDTNFPMWGPWNEQLPQEPAAPCVLEWIKQCEISPLIIVDPLVAFLPPGTSENDSVEIRAFFEQLRALLRAGAAGLVLLHHTGKSETSQNYRGSSDIEAACDVAYKVTNSGENVLDRLALKLFRPRFGADQRSELVLIYEEDDDGVASFRSDERPAAAAINVSQQLKDLFAKMQGCTATEFIQAAKARKLTEHAARNYLKNGVDAGSIAIEQGPHNAQYHRFADGTLFPPGSGKVQ